MFIIDSINPALKTIEQEAKGVMALKEIIEHESFKSTCELIANTTGKLVISGMGKSGHVSRKIAATFASTGTPAIFIHPSEASHGDMGMIEKRDILIMLSNSGETKELMDIIYYSKRCGNTIIAITREKNSTIAKQADIVFALPKIAEADINIAAPTTSTIMQMGLGDALAINVMYAKGFNADSYKLLHPGGKIGASLVKIVDLMHMGDRLPIVNENDDITTIVEEISNKRLGCTAVVNGEGDFIGVITDGDIRRTFLKKPQPKLAHLIMTKNPKTISEEEAAVKAVQMMEMYKITNIFVMKNNKPYGLIHIHDCFKAGIC